ncbi:hypothetical protein HAX54_052569, partial [Datura stramonium]|nr:hypothetical protein [Datura stramonium]
MPSSSTSFGYIQFTSISVDGGISSKGKGICACVGLHIEIWRKRSQVLRLPLGDGLGINRGNLCYQCLLYQWAAGFTKSSREQIEGYVHEGEWMNLVSQQIFLRLMSECDQQRALVVTSLDRAASQCAGTVQQWKYFACCKKFFQLAFPSLMTILRTHAKVPQEVGDRIIKCGVPFNATRIEGCMQEGGKRRMTLMMRAARIRVVVTQSSSAGYCRPLRNLQGPLYLWTSLCRALRRSRGGEEKTVSEIRCSSIWKVKKILTTPFSQCQGVLSIQEDAQGCPSSA